MAISILEQPSQTTTTKADTYDRILSQLSLLQRGHENIHITYNANTNTAVLKDGSTYEVNGNMYINEVDLTLPTPRQNERAQVLGVTGSVIEWSDITDASIFNLSSKTKGGWYVGSLRVMSTYMLCYHIDDDNYYITTTSDVPIGTKVVRYGGKNEPGLAGYLGTWENKSFDHRGRFFRCEGASNIDGINYESESFDRPQHFRFQRDMMIDFSKDADDRDSHFPSIRPTTDFRGVYDSSASGGRVTVSSSETSAGRVTLNLSNNLDTRRLGHEMRPLNETVQIWERIA